MRVRIKDVAYALPDRVVTNAELAAEHPEWDMDRVVTRAGVLQRHIAGPGETALDLGRRAVERLAGSSPGLLERVNAIIFCTQSPDYVMPPNACLLHEALDLPEGVLAFDINLACSGYPYALAIARGLIVSGAASDVLVVTGDTYSRYIHEGDRATRTLFGDGAAASWVAASDDEGGILDLVCATAGKSHRAFTVQAGGCRLPRSPDTARAVVDRSGNVRTAEHIHMDGMAVYAFANSRVPAQIQGLLARNGLRVEDVDLFVFHQASRVALDSLARLMRLRPEQLFTNLARIGNTVSASIPMALHDAVREGRLTPGRTVVLSGFGVGLSYAAVLMRW